MPSAAFTTALRWTIVAVAILFALMLLMRAADPQNSKWEDLAQGAAGAVTVVALFIAAGIYFLERKDRVKIQFEVSSTRSLLPVGNEGASRPNPRHRTVLVGIRVLITNNSARRLEVNCISLGLFQPVGTGSVARSWASLEEMRLEPIAVPIPYDREDGNPRHALALGQVRQCLRQDQARHNARPLFMWRPLTLEPSEADDRYFEYPVGCQYPFVRVLVKIRMNADDDDVYETKAIIPVDDICEARGSGMVRSISTEGASQVGGVEAATQPLAAAP